MNMKRVQADRYKLWILWFVLLTASYLLLTHLSRYSLLQVHLSNSHSSNFKVYWITEQDGSWSESKSASVYANSRKQHFILPLPIAITDIKSLRVDPNRRKGMTTIMFSMSLHHLANETIRFQGKQGFSRFSPNEHVTKLSREASFISFVSGGNDPGFIVNLPDLLVAPMPWIRFAQSLVLSFLVLGLMRAFSWASASMRWVPMAMLVAGGGILAMATLSEKDAHPDEITHLTNAEYYFNHYSPPEACTEATRYTYTTYGVSRLDNREIAYYVGGRFLQLVDVIPTANYIKLRYLNVAMFFILALLACRHSYARYLLMPILFTPQAWYLFSYYNSDALSLFAVFLVAYQFVVPKSMLRRLVAGERPPQYMAWVLFMALLIALQYWVKLNYVFYPCFLLALGGSWCLYHRRFPHLTAAVPMVVAIVLGTGLFLSWEVSRHAVNDFSLSEKASQCRELEAGYLYKPSTPLEKTHPNFRLRDKGMSLVDMVTKRNWAEHIFFTALGSYGYSEFLNNDSHFKLSGALILIIFLYVLIMLGFYGGRFARITLVMMLGSMVTLTLAAAINNWVHDYQPQGRYLMPYLPMLGTIIAMYYASLNLKVISLLSWPLVALSMYSFFAVALVEIVKP